MLVRVSFTLIGSKVDIFSLFFYDYLTTGDSGGPLFMETSLNRYEQIGKPTLNKLMLYKNYNGAAMEVIRSFYEAFSMVQLVNASHSYTVA